MYVCVCGTRINRAHKSIIIVLVNYNHEYFGVHKANDSHAIYHNRSNLPSPPTHSAMRVRPCVGVCVCACVFV